jgi:hypothetical protein
LAFSEHFPGDGNQAGVIMDWHAAVLSIHWPRVYGRAYDFWLVCGNCDAGVLRAGGSQPVVRFGICGGLCFGIGLRFPSRRVAVWTRGSRLVVGRGAAMVAKKIIGVSFGKKTPAVATNRLLANTSLSFRKIAF